MIKFNHYKPSHLVVEKNYGVKFEYHPKRKSLDIYFGKHVFVWWIGRNYKP